MMPNTIVEGLKTYFETYAGITGSTVLTDFLGSLPTQYAIVPLAGERVVAEYLNGKKDIQYPFAFQTMKYTLQEAERIDAQGFMELFADWLDTQSRNDTLPTLPTGKHAEKIEALGHGYLADEGQSNTGVYQVQCLLSYMQD